MKRIAILLVTLVITSLSNITLAQDSNNGMKKIKFDKGLQENEAITRFLATNKLSENDNTFRLIRSTVDRMGITHNRYQQYFKGIKVEFGTLITHHQTGLVNSINAELYDASGLNLTPVLSSKSSLNKAVQHLGIKKASWFNSSTKKIAESSPEGELVIIPNYLDNLQSVVLAYKFKIEVSNPNLKGNSYINATNGASILFNPIMKHFNRDLGEYTKNKDVSNGYNFLATGTANTRYLGVQSIETRLEANGTYTLNDEVNGIFTRNALNASEETRLYYDTFEEFTDNDNNWTAAEFDNAEFDNAALDAHFGAIKVKEYWTNIHNRDSYDDNGSDLISFIHVGTNYVNAFWDGTAMAYGDGNSNPLTTFDICAHEIGHAVTDTTADLVYANQSGGLNEGYSDIWAAAIQHYVYGTGTDSAPDATVWAIGEDIGAIRSMSNPKSFGDPDTYLGNNWRETGDEGLCAPGSTNDNCGVHSNSGVLNHWFHILVAGKSGTNDAGDIYNVTGIGMNKAEEIAYLTLRDYLTPNATFQEAREASLTLANNLYCHNSSEFMALQNAWHAVNIGEAFVVTNDDVVLRSVTNSLDVNCGASSTFVPQIKIENGGNNTINSVDLSYSVDGGPIVNEVLSTNLASCETMDYNITSLNIPNKGVHAVSVTTTITNDGRVNNNTRTSIVIVNDEGISNNVNSFESSNDVLVAYNDGNESTSLWERGLATSKLLNSGSNNVYATNLTGNHPDRTKSYLVSQCYDLSNMTDAILKFKMGFDLEENWDIVYMEYSVNGGADWSILGSAGDSGWYNSDRTGGTDCFNCPGAQWTGRGEDFNLLPFGTNATLKEYNYILDDFDSNSATPQSSIIFRFTFHADAATNEEGVIIDDFVIEGAVLGVGENEFEQFSYTPNPTEGILNINLTPNGLEEKINITISDLRGRNVYTNSYTASSNFTTSLELQNLTSGMYLVNVNQGDKNQTAKIIVK